MSDIVISKSDSKSKGSCFEGQCYGCLFVAAKCANDGETDCPYFAPAED